MVPLQPAMGHNVLLRERQHSFLRLTINKYSLKYCPQLVSIIILNIIAYYFICTLEKGKVKSGRRCNVEELANVREELLKEVRLTNVR